VTNWSIHSQSARELMSETFRRFAADPKLNEAEALRQASIAIMNGSGFSERGRHVQIFLCAPLFWAPYTLIGDGNRR